LKPLALGLLPDFREEQWPSMELCYEMLAEQLRLRSDVVTSTLRPHFRNHFSAFPFSVQNRLKNLNRLLNRFRHYPQAVRDQVDRFDFFHLPDHSYSQLVHELPPGRVGVYCHDLDTFQCLLRPRQFRRPGWFRRMTRRIFDGFRKACVIFTTTHAIREEVLALGFVSPENCIHAPNGIAEEFRPEVTPTDSEWIPSAVRGRRYLLHIGSCIPRKRIDLLLRIVSETGREFPDLHLIQIGGEWTREQAELLATLNLNDRVTQLRGLPRHQIAAIARQAELLLLPSDAEGFGLPLIEAMACGTPVLASDIPVLREVGGEAALYATPGNVHHWVERISGILNRSIPVPERAFRLSWASKYSWARQAEIILSTYQRIRES
jgi:glycosyltransferase involved in cell wall biosynthesis